MMSAPVSGTAYIAGEGGVNTIAGGAGTDTIAGGPGTDHVTGGTGGDTFIVYDTRGASNGTTFTGGSGSNTLSFARMTHGVTVNLVTDHADYGVAFSNVQNLSLIHISEPTRQAEISYAV